LIQRSALVGPIVLQFLFFPPAEGPFTPQHFVVCSSHGSVSVFQVGIGFSVYRSVFLLLSEFQNTAISVRYFTLRQSATCGC